MDPITAISTALGEGFKFGGTLAQSGNIRQSQAAGYKNPQTASEQMDLILLVAFVALIGFLVFKIFK
jgi:hypothetical protein